MILPEQLMFDKNCALMDFNTAKSQNVDAEKLAKIAMKAAYFEGEVAAFYHEKGEIPRSAINLTSQASLYITANRPELAERALEEAKLRLDGIKSGNDMLAYVNKLLEKVHQLNNI